MRKRLQLIILSLTISSLLFISCHHDNKEDKTSPYFTHFYTGNKDAILRDIHFDMSPDEVKSIEKSRLYEATEDHLFYEFSYPTDSTAFSEYAEVQYFFDENDKLDVIASHLFLNDSTLEKGLRTSLQQYFNQRYGSAEADKNSELWNGDFTDKKTGTDYNYTIRVKNIVKQSDDDLTGVSIEYHLER
jgi:hypothetical protein